MSEGRDNWGGGGLMVRIGLDTAVYTDLCCICFKNSTQTATVQMLEMDTQH